MKNEVNTSQVTELQVLHEYKKTCKLNSLNLKEYLCGEVSPIFLPHLFFFFFFKLSNKFGIAVIITDYTTKAHNYFKCYYLMNSSMMVRYGIIELVTQ